MFKQHKEIIFIAPVIWLISSSCYILHMWSVLLVCLYGKFFSLQFFKELHQSRWNLCSIHFLQKLNKITWLERRPILWIQKQIMQQKYKTTQHWPKYGCFYREKHNLNVRGRRWSWLLQTRRLSISSFLPSQRILWLAKRYCTLSLHQQ